MSEVGHRTNNGNWSMMSEKALSKNFPLHRACRDGDVDGLSLLLHEEAARTHITLEDTYYGWTPTHWAAYFGKLECLRVLVGAEGRGPASPALTTSRFTQTPAHIAAFAGHPHCLTWLLQAGAHPDAQDYLGETALHKAARTGSLECVNILLASKAKMSVRNNNGQTAGQLAEACSYAELGAHLNNLTQSQDMEGGGGGSSIVRSIPAHGLNGGVFPQNPTSGLLANKIVTPQVKAPASLDSGVAPLGNGSVPAANGLAPYTNGTTNGSHSSSSPANGSSTCTSSNGYYGFQPTHIQNDSQQNGHQNGSINGHDAQSEEVDMETDAEPANNCQNGVSSHINGTVATNGHTHSHTNGTSNPGFTNGQATATFGFTNGHSNGHTSGHTSGTNGSPAVHNHLGEDITLNPGVSQNYIPIGGRKRSREEGFIPEMKRMRTEGQHPHPAPCKPPTSSLHPRVPFLDITNCTEWTARDTWGYCGSPLHGSLPGECLGGGLVVMEGMEGGSEEHDTSCSKVEVNSSAELCTEMLRETHGCEAYMFFVS